MEAESLHARERRVSGSSDQTLEPLFGMFGSGSGPEFSELRTQRRPLMTRVPPTTSSCYGGRTSRSAGSLSGHDTAPADGTKGRKEK